MAPLYDDNAGGIFQVVRQETRGTPKPKRHEGISKRNSMSLRVACYHSCQGVRVRTAAQIEQLRTDHRWYIFDTGEGCLLVP